MPPLDDDPALRLLLAAPAVQVLSSSSRDVETHLVGGILRDAFLGLASHDYDAVVERDGLPIAHRIADALPARFVHLGGKEFSAYRLVGEIDSIDLWDREQNSFENDMARRDFTINALALELRSGKLCDLFGGLRDLESRTLRAITPESFSGDPLRVLRLPRLAIKLPGFSADPATLDLARHSSAAIVEVAAERVRDELSLILAHNGAANGLSLLHSLALYPGLWLGSPGVETESAAGIVAGAVAEFGSLPTCASILQEALGTIREERALREVEGDWHFDLRLARFATTFRHLGRQNQAVEALDRFGAAGYLSPRETQAVRSLLQEETLPGNGIDRRRFYHRLGGLWPTAALSLAGRAAASGNIEDAHRSLADLACHASQEAAEAVTPPKLVTGHEIQEMFGVAPGPFVGELLKGLRTEQVEGRIADREEALAFVRSRLTGS